MRTPIQDIINLLENIEYKKIYGSENAKTSLAITLSKARRNLNLTQKKFAEKLGKTQPYIAKLESGDANPTIGAIGSMLAVVGLSLEIDTKLLIPSLLQPDQHVTLPKEAYVLSAEYDKPIEKIGQPNMFMCSSSSNLSATTETVVAY